MKFFIHIGTEKTGTTAIQEWLASNAKTLEENGAAFSAALGRATNRKLSIYARPLAMADDGFRALRIKTQEDYDRFRTSLREDFQKEISALKARGIDRYIISGEHLSSRLTTEEMVRDVEGFVAPFCEDVTIFCYLRPQVDLLVSYLSVQARLSRVNKAALMFKRDHPYVDYLALHNRWSAAFPGKMHLAPYKRVGNVTADFLRRAGLGDLPMERVERINERVDYRTAALGYNINLPDQIDGKPNRNRFYHQDKLPMETPITIDRELAERIHRRFEQRNAQLLSQCDGICEADLTPDFAKYPERGNLRDVMHEVSFAPMLQEMVVRFNVDLWIERARTCAALAERDLLRGDRASARDQAAKASDYLDFARQGAFQNQCAEVATVSEDLDKVRAKIDVPN